MDRDQLLEVNALSEIGHIANGQNTQYNLDWIREFVSTDVIVVKDGRKISSLGQSDQLTTEQKALIKKSDANSSIQFVVKYIPQNNLKSNVVRELDFSVIIDPVQDASFPGGQSSLDDYLDKRILKVISKDLYQGYDVSAVQFTVSAEGEISDVHHVQKIYQKVKNTERDNQLLNAIQNMPCWVPAQFSDGTKVSQKFVLTVGNLENCVIHTLGIN